MPTSAQQLLEPIALPPAVEQGVDMVYVDREIGGNIRWRNTKLDNVTFARYAGAPLDLLQAINPLYTELRRGLVGYQKEWSSLPQFRLDFGPALALGAAGERVTLLRERLGLPAGSRFDEALHKRVSAYQHVHGMKADGLVGEDMITSLNRGALHYAQVLMINMERARRLPAPGELKRHIIVDAGSARLSMYEDGALVDSMRAVVGSSKTQTPMMAAFIRYASVNPYWNLPPEFNVKMVAPRVLEQGVGYLSERKYEVFADFTDGAPMLDPAMVDWQAVRDGKLSLRIRRGPGPGNSMGDIKFMMPNDLGIYLHDTHDKTVFAKGNRWVSNGCVRVEDAQRLATWLFGGMPKAIDPDVEERVDMAAPVAVFLTYLTAEATKDGVVFRDDPYQRDTTVLARYFGAERLLR
ncbi:L,D-transpeptidase family protein [Sphingomonas sp.]|uniref:L,D-transpeptidase family protein n=1 Tax=Sphingomonas sp. TaxID=28214 RepID=UPI0017FBF5BD|nr:L,D-transpeptidase family protein [Sphingomonas sp.]MBA3512582.1 L,D-transpeptidase family protein [Sphingomonas sp.]